MAMRAPPHPGRLVRQECVEALDLTVTAAARLLGVTRQTLNNLVTEKSAVSPEMAIRLEKAFGGSADVWLRLQAAYDLAAARRREHLIQVERYRPDREVA